jgi:hypothetical protein
MLYGKSGTLPGPALGQLMQTSLAQSGRIFSPQEVSLLKGAVQQLETAVQQGDLDGAVKTLASAQKFGPAGEIASYSAVAQQLNAAARKIIEQGNQVVAEAQSKLATPQTALEGALQLVDAKTTYAPLKTLRDKAQSAYQQAAKDEAGGAMLKQAEELHRALARLQLRDGKELAVRDLNRVIERYPGTQAARRAATHIAEITGQAPTDGSSSSSESFRQWTDDSGRHQIQAKLVARKEGWVLLETREGKRITLPISKLSAADQKWLQENR